MAHLRLRQGLIRRLRILVPVIIAALFITGILVLAFDWANPMTMLRCAGFGALLCFMVVTVEGTVPINQAVLDWDVTAPPDNWNQMIDRWDRLDSIRTVLALLAFGLMLSAAR